MRHKLAFSHFELALDHHTAIVLLCLNHLRSSAFPLARSMFDATWKGAWVAFAAPDDLLEKYKLWRFDPNPKTAIPVLRQELHNFRPQVGALLARVFSEGFDHLSDYSHAGLLPVTRWMGEDKISAKYSDEEMEELLALCDRLGTCCGLFLADLSSSGANEVLEALYAVIGNERLKAAK